MFRTRRPDSTRPTGGKCRGFSVIEVAVVLLIIAILAAVVVPQILNYMKMYRLGVASRNVATALHRARFLATSNNRRAGINIADSSRIDIEQYDPNGTAEPEHKGSVTLPPGVMISREAPAQIAFDGRGVVTPMPRQSPNITLIGPDGYSQTVTVSPTGQVTVSDAQRQ